MRRTRRGAFEHRHHDVGVGARGVNAVQRRIFAGFKDAVAGPDFGRLVFQPAGANHGNVGFMRIEAGSNGRVFAVAGKVDVTEKMLRIISADGNFAEPCAIAHEG